MTQTYFFFPDHPLFIKTSKPLLAILSPSITYELECFYLNILPFNDDVKEYPFKPLNQYNKDIDQDEQDILDNLVDQMDLTILNKQHELLIPEYSYNPILQRFYATLKARALDPNAEIPLLHPLLQEYLNPDQSIIQSLQPILQQMNKLYNQQQDKGKELTKKEEAKE